MSEASPPRAPTSLRGKILMVIAAVIVAGLGYLAWSAQKPRPPVLIRPAPSASQPASHAAPASRPTLVKRQRPPRVAARPQGLPTTGFDGGAPRPSLTRNDIRMAQAQLHRAADVCVADALKTNPELGLRMAVRYTLYVQGGQARAVNPRISKSLIKDPKVEKCILDKISHSRWPVDSTDGVLHVAESFNFKHLLRTHISD